MIKLFHKKREGQLLLQPPFQNKSLLVVLVALVLIIVVIVLIVILVVLVLILVVLLHDARPPFLWTATDLLCPQKKKVCMKLKKQ